MARVETEPDVSVEGQPSGEQPAGEIVGRSPQQLFWSRFIRDRFAVVGLIFIAVMLALALLAPVIAQRVAHHGPNQIFFLEMTTPEGIPKGPNKQFWFGADNAGRDLFVRVLYGARTSLFIAFVATGVEMVIGVTLGVISGYYRGKTDTLISRFSDIFLSLPILLLALGLVSACGLQKNGCLGGLVKPGLLLVSYVIALFSWPYLSRIVRGQVISLREKEFVESARSLGASNTRIMFRDILPNIVAPIIVYTTLLIPANILFEAALSYLGVGVPQSTPSWGRQLADASQWFESAWWMLVFPGVFLLLTTLAFNLVGDGLRDALDPRAAAMSYRRVHRRKREREARRTGTVAPPAESVLEGSV
jgi:peptide/nickel transport system permease protein